MPVDAIPGFSASGSASLIRASVLAAPAASPPAAVSQGQEPGYAPSASQAQATAQTSQVMTNAVGAPATAVVLPKPVQPFLMVPTEPLTPKVLAELIGRQLP